MPFDFEQGRISDFWPPLISISQPSVLFAVRVEIFILDIDAIEGIASPRKPRNCTFTDSQLISDLGFIANLDLPISIFKINKNKFYDFELQISPFVDFVYTYQNEFHISGGLEFLVYPRITRSLQLRASGGISKNDLEVFIGIGLFY